MQEAEDGQSLCSVSPGTLSYTRKGVSNGTTHGALCSLHGKLHALMEDPTPLGSRPWLRLFLTTHPPWLPTAHGTVYPAGRHCPSPQPTLREILSPTFLTHPLGLSLSGPLSFRATSLCLFPVPE